MTAVFALAFPFFGLIAIGFFCGRFKKLPQEGLVWMNFFLIYISLPALFFRILAKTPLEKLNNLPFVVGTTLATYCAFSLGFAYVMLKTRGDMKLATVSGVTAAYGNIGYMGPGLALSTIGPEAAVPVALIFCFDNILLFSLTPFLMALGGSEHSKPSDIAKETAIKIATHPFILATIAGVFAAYIQFSPPEPLDKLLGFLSGAAAPCALFTLGVTVAARLENLRALLKLTLQLLPILSVKLFIHPLLVVLILSVLGTFEPAWVHTAALMACLPPALNVFIIATQYQTGMVEASNAVLLGTLISVMSLTGLMYLVQQNLLPINLF
jgi:malonate transporter and related proteins